MTNLSDLEITKRCAEKMGFDPMEDIDGVYVEETDGYMTDYDPLHDDAQAMALVKRFELDIHSRSDQNGWYVGNPDGIQGMDADLNRAICKAVANLP